MPRKKVAAAPTAADMERDADEMRDAAEASQSAEEKPESFTQSVARAHALRNQIEDLDKTLKKCKADLDDLLRIRIPQGMDQIGVMEIGLNVGNVRVRLSLDYAAFGSISKAPDFNEAVAYLEANGFEGGVLTTVSAQFKRAERADALTLAERLKESAIDTDIVDDVNSATLRAFVRDAFDRNPQFDAAKVGVTLVRQAKFTVS